MAALLDAVLVAAWLLALLAAAWRGPVALAVLGGGTLALGAALLLLSQSARARGLLYGLLAAAAGRRRHRGQV